jgi:hypothetical protein
MFREPVPLRLGFNLAAVRWNSIMSETKHMAEFVRCTGKWQAGSGG